LYPPLVLSARTTFCEVTRAPALFESPQDKYTIFVLRIRPRAEALGWILKTKWCICPRSIQNRAGTLSSTPSGTFLPSTPQLISQKRRHSTSLAIALSKPVGCTLTCLWLHPSFVSHCHRTKNSEHIGDTVAFFCSDAHSNHARRHSHQKMQ
jgi:hypothetical protein